VVLIAALPWAAFFGDEIWPIFFYPDHRNILNMLVGVLLVILVVAFRLGLYRGLKLIVASSAFAGLLALMRGLWLSFSGVDCSTFCLGVLNNVLGLGCGSSDQGCAMEFFFLSFLVVFLFGVCSAFLGNKTPGQSGKCHE